MNHRQKLRCASARVVSILTLAIIGAGLIAASILAPRWRAPQPVEADVAAEAKDYLRERSVSPLNEELSEVLSKSQSSIPSRKHPLLSQPAPDFRLTDHKGQPQSLSEHLAKGPVVLVFYYGYYCNHCVAQLFALNDDIAKFHQLGAQVVAISPDRSEDTAQKFAKYGMFEFPVLSDPDNKVAALYSVYAPATEQAPETLLHGTFVIDNEGIVRWCHYDAAPFTDNATLLVELNKLKALPISTSSGP
jgi:peroxiredoxin